MAGIKKYKKKKKDEDELLTKLHTAETAVVSLVDMHTVDTLH